MICPKCGSEEGQQNFCRQCGSPIDTETATVPLTERMKQEPMGATDILIELNEELTTKSKEHRSDPFVLIYADVDREHNLPAGSTEQHLEEAAQASEMEIIEKGQTRARLRRRPPRPLRVHAFGESRRRRR